jgi:hypothetical protein
MGLADARIAANRIFEQLAGGADPLEEQRNAAAEAKAARARTVGVIAERFLAGCRDRVKPRTLANINGSMRLAVAEWRDRPIATIHRRDICALVDRVKLERGPASATNLQSWIRLLLGWSVEKGELDASPAAGMRAPAVLKPRSRVLTDDEVRQLWLVAGFNNMKKALCRPPDYADVGLNVVVSGGDRCVGVGIIRGPRGRRGACRSAGSGRVLS